MTTKRVAKIQDLIKEEVSRLLLFKVKDPRLQTVSVTRVKITPDLKRAVVFYSVFDDQADRGRIQSGLERATGFFRTEVGRVAGLKFVPEIVFEFDRSLEYAQHMDRLLSGLGKTADDESGAGK